MNTPVPAEYEDEVAFISGVTSDAVVAATSYGTWSHAGENNPATYDPDYAWYATKWGDTILSTSGTPGGNVTYWFDTTSNWSIAEQDAFVSGLALWSAVADITFSPAADAASTDFTFIRGNDGSFQQFPNRFASTVGSGTESGPSTGAFIEIDTTNTSHGTGPLGGPFTDGGGYPAATIVHEMGHLLGMGHAGPYNGEVDPSTQQFGPYDTLLWSVMSYIFPDVTTAAFFDQYTVTNTNWTVDGVEYRPTTPMMLDILAVQRIYGAPTSGPLTDGGQTFGFNCDVEGLAGQYFDFNINTQPIITIWDGGTGNTLDLSGFTEDSTVNLAPGTFTSCNGMTNNIGIALGTTIESWVGGSGNDQVSGSAGGGVLDGGGGNDAIASSSDMNTAIGGEGNDWLSLTGNQNQLSGGDGHDALSVVGASNTLSGDAGNDQLTASGGANHLLGGAGSDAYFVDNAGDAVTENAGEGIDTVYATAHFRLSSHVENLVLQGSADFQAYGNGASNAVYGNAGSNILDGGTGVDGMYGLAGNDVYFVDDAGDGVIEALNDGTDAVFSIANFRLSANVEALVLQGSADLQGYGNTLANAIYGNFGSNLLDGGTGADLMVGGTGDDVFFVDDAADAVLESAGEGADAVLASAHFGLSANVEALVLQDAADLQGYGNDLANSIYGNTGNNLLSGGAAADMMAGGLGNDTYFVDDAADIVFENANEGIDAVFASDSYALAANVETLVLQGAGDLAGTGNAIANTLYGNGGDNALDGGADADVLIGDGGNDTFVFNVGEADGDIVVDFSGNGGGPGDSLEFIGYGADATFTNIDATRIGR
jgi:Ca2+-binding RTX toxin-like protein